MKFENAYKGVKKLFVVQIIEIAAALLALIGAIIATINVASEANLAAGGIIITISSIALIVGFVFTLIGLIQAGRDDSHFKTGLWVILIAIVLGIVAAILRAIPDVVPVVITIANILDALSTASSIVVLVLTLFGISSLASQLGNEEMAERGSSLVNWVIILLAASVILSLVPTFFLVVPNPIGIMFSFFAIVAAVIELFVYIGILIYYIHAIEMLGKN